MTELGKLLPEAQTSAATPGQGPGSAHASGTATPVSKAHEDGETPLVDATIRFLKEFVPVEPKEREGRMNGGGNGYANGYGYGKGKDRMEEQEEGLDSFMPTYVYEAMKEKKRFDNMRVSILFYYLISSQLVADS